MRLGVFFTFRVSLKQWIESGLFEREKMIYETYLQNGIFSVIYWFTYGEDDSKIAEKLYAQHKLDDRIQLVPKPKWFKKTIGNVLYSFCLPLLKKKYIKKCSILKTNQMNGAWTAILAKWIFHKKLIIRTGYTFSDFLIRQKRSVLWIRLAQWIEHQAYRHGDRFLVSSQHDRAYLSTLLSDTRKITIVPNYIDITLFSPAIHGIPKTNTMIYVGRLKEQKNLKALLNALEDIGIPLTIVGDGEDKDLLKEIALKKCLQVTFKPSVPNNEIPDLLREHRFFILPSFYEGMPKSLLEAMACGLICIGTPVSGINELLVDKETGYLAKNCSTSALKDIIIQTIDQGDDSIGNKSRKFIETHYSLEAVFQKEKEIIVSLIVNPWEAENTKKDF